MAVPDKAAPMVPTAALVDADGRVRARVGNVCPKKLQPTVETVPGQAWYAGVQEQILVARARTTLHVAMGSLMESLECPIAIVRKEGSAHVLSKASVDIKPGGLVIPIHCMNVENIVSALRPGLVIHPRAVHCKVFGSVVTDGNEDKAVEFGLVVNPEVRYANKNKAASDSPLSSLQMHPFWLVQRQAKEEEEPNCILENQYVTSVLGCTWRWQCVEDPCQRSGTTSSWAAMVPVITNTKFIKAGDSVILAHTTVQKPAKPKTKERERTWHDDFRTMQKKFKKQTDVN